MDQSSMVKMRLAPETAFLQRFKAFTDHAVREVEELVCDAKLSALARAYEANLKKRDVDIGFNLFALISDIYYRENLHSDIFKVLLDPKGGHHEQERFLKLFLEFIRSHGAAINLSDYANPQVVREEGRIDVLIKNEDSKRAIIIENKINNASDQPRQLPKYLKIIEGDGYTCDAIIYLRLNEHTGPDMTGWSEDERKRVTAKLRIICAYEDSKMDLLNGWIRKCERSATSRDAQHVLRQYGDLIKKLGGNVMNKPIMEKFYTTMLEEENFKIAQSLRSMLDDLVDYRRDRIIDIFKGKFAPFEKLWPCKNNIAVFDDLKWNGAFFAIDVTVEPDSYSFEFFDRNDDEGVNGQAKVKAMLQKIGRLNEYRTGQYGRFTKNFEFPSQENDLIEHIKAFKSKLEDVVTTAKR